MNTSYPIKKWFKKDITKRDTKKNILIDDSNNKFSSFVSFTYQSRNIRFNGEETNISGHNISFKDGKIKEEKFNGTIKGNYFGPEFLEMQKKIINDFLKIMNPASWLPPYDKK